MTSRIMKTVVAVTLSGAALLGGSAAANAQDGGTNIPLHPGQLGGSGGAAVGEAAAAATNERQNSDIIVKERLDSAVARHPGKNVMIIQQETHKGVKDVIGIVENTPVTIGGNTFDLVVFDTGSFTNDGDMGVENWAWAGNFTRSEDQRTVTFTAK